MPRILLVAPDSDLRRSLEFSLTAEGYEVTSRASIGARERPDAFDCTVVDHHALGNDGRAAANFCSIFAPVILLANKLDHELSPSAFRTLLKPLLGAALTDAIYAALATRVLAK
jgi:CheY-like chemotaxis protein